ncbi:MAG: cupin domain-containing protein [Cellvibrionaceae bacterium]|nr:cupin domain-containing protein [Cellvibrionaceae bacterium]
MNKTADYWVKRLQLAEHPEGGCFKRTYSAEHTEHFPSHEATRPTCTAIYYLLESRSFSAFHRLKSDEIWHYYCGTCNIKIHILDTNGKLVHLELGINDEALPQQTIYATNYFAAELCSQNSDDFALVGCTISPGFHFNDFSLGSYKELEGQYPRHKKLIERLTIR